MKARHKRLLLIGGGLALLIAATVMVLSAFQQNLVFFHSPSDVKAGKVASGTTFRIGGIVQEGSIQRLPDGVSVNFAITDTAETVQITYTGSLPDLFRDGKGAVVQGSIQPDGQFRATEVLAKHDENYMPPEAAQAIEHAQAAAATTVVP